MNHTDLEKLFTLEVLQELFPPERTNDFFEALFGDADEGAYDIALSYHSYDGNEKLRFMLNLHERPGACLACNLTYGLPEVFSRHPVINIKGLVDDICVKIGDNQRCSDWKLGTTIQQQKDLHSIPLDISLV